MEKSLFSKDYGVFLRELRAARKEAGLTQEEIGKRLGQTQSFISKCERGERRIDVVELRAFCKAIGISFPSFVQRFNTALSKTKKPDEGND
jgi:transcriptional regulator with XRE-family HTH domain